jgi:hypothetical protein
MKKYYLEIMNETEVEQQEAIARECKVIRQISLQEQIQKTSDQTMHCKVCSLDIEDYFEHIKSLEHQKKYFEEIDEADGCLVVNKLDQMF